MTTAKFTSMGKEELRAACRTAGISYGKLNNAGMRDVLIRHFANETTTQDYKNPEVPLASELKVDAVKTLINSQISQFMQQETEPETTISGAVFGSMFGAPVQPSSNCGNTVKVIDGKKVSSAAVKTEVTTPRVPAAPKVVVPKSPKVVRSGYSIQKERETRNGVKRPSEGTICHSIWATYDADPEMRASKLSTVALANGWDMTTCQVQFYTWRRFNGITGRSTK